MARRRRHSLSEIKDLILDSAEEIITRDGISKLTARQIAADIGYTVGSIYMVFPSMTNLLLHFNASTLDNIADRLILVRQQEDAQKEQCLEELAKAYLNYASRNFNRWQVLFDYKPSEDSAQPGIDWFQQKIDTVIRQFAIPLHQLSPQRSEPDITLAARSLWAGLHGIGTLFLIAKPHATTAEQIQESGVLLVRSFIGGWLSESVV